VKATVTHLEFEALEPIALAVPTLLRTPLNHVHPPSGCRNVKNS
jgi:hypothetical protein